METHNLIDKFLDKEEKGYIQNVTVSFVVATFYFLLFSHLTVRYRQLKKNGKLLHTIFHVSLIALGVLNLSFAIIFFCSQNQNTYTYSLLYYACGILQSVIVYTVMRICYFGVSLNKVSINTLKVLSFLIPSLFFSYSQFTILAPIGVYMGSIFRIFSLVIHLLSALSLISLVYKTNSETLEELEAEDYFPITLLGVDFQEFMGSYAAPMIGHVSGVVVELAVIILYYFDQIYYPWTVNMIISMVHLIQMSMISWCMYLPLLTAPGNENARPPENIQRVIGDGLIA